MSRRTSGRSRFAALVQPHFDALYGAARRLALSPSDAEDLVQDVCLKAFESIDELENIEFRRAWLLKVLYHKFVDRQRKRARRSIRPIPVPIRSNLSKSPGARSGLTNSWTGMPGLPR